MAGENKLKAVDKIVKCYCEYASTMPILCILDDGTQAVVKYPNNPEGNLVLINEYLSYRIAQVAGLDVPRCGLCVLNEAYTRSEDFSSYLSQNSCEFSEKNFGTCFYSSFISDILPINTVLLPYISNRDNFYTMVLFDHLIYNKDRHPGNLLIQTIKPIRYFAIDHSHVFKNQAIWDRYALQQGIQANDYLDRDILTLNSDVYSYFFNYMALDEEILCRTCSQMQLALTTDFYHHIMTEIPQEWGGYASRSDLTKLEEYLNYRTEHLFDIVQMIIDERRNVR